MAKSVYTWGKVAKNGKSKRGGSSSGIKKPFVSTPKSGVKKTKKIKTGY